MRIDTDLNFSAPQQESISWNLAVKKLKKKNRLEAFREHRHLHAFDFSPWPYVRQGQYLMDSSVKFML